MLHYPGRSSSIGRGGGGGGWGGGGSRFSKMLKGLRYSFLCAGQTAVMWAILYVGKSF